MPDPLIPWAPRGRRPADIPDEWLEAYDWPVINAAQIRAILGLPDPRKAQRKVWRLKPEGRRRHNAATARARAKARKEGRIAWVELGVRVTAALRELIGREAGERGERTLRSVALELIAEGLERRAERRAAAQATHDPDPTPHGSPREKGDPKGDSREPLSPP